MRRILKTFLMTTCLALPTSFGAECSLQTVVEKTESRFCESTQHAISAFKRSVAQSSHEVNFDIAPAVDALLSPHLLPLITLGHSHFSAAAQEEVFTILESLEFCYAKHRLCPCPESTSG